MRARALGCFHSPTVLSEGADRVDGQLHGDNECPFSGVTKSGRVWRKVPESDARSVTPSHTPSIAFGTFLQTLPDLVTPLKGHSLSPRSCPPTPGPGIAQWLEHRTRD